MTIEGDECRSSARRQPSTHLRDDRLVSTVESVVCPDRDDRVFIRERRGARVGNDEHGQDATSDRRR